MCIFLNILYAHNFIVAKLGKVELMLIDAVPADNGVDNTGVVVI